MTHDAATTIDWHPEDPATLANPYPLFSRMRDEDPCHWSPRLRSWVLTRYDDVRRACHDRDRYSSDRLRPFFAAMPADEASRIADIVRYLSLWMVFKDPPEHTRLRRLAGKVFTARSMQAMRPQIGQTTEWLLQRIGDRESFDFIADFAGPLPCLVIMAMLGVPREDLALVKRMSDDIALFIGSSRASAAKYAIAQAATREMADFFRELIAQRRRQAHDDLLGELIEARDGDDRLSEDELIATCILMLFAGHETTTNHLANGLAALMRFPDQMAALRADPGLAPAAVEELLRYEGPSGAQARVVAVAHELHGHRLQMGDRVFLMLNAANRDPRAFPDPDRLDLRREAVAHLSFGHGPHICLGFPLARTEGQVALPALLAHFEHIEPAAGRPEWLDSLVFRGMRSLPVRVRRRAAAAP
ncbi:MAG: cytochrome P450 [Burkholderiales bacterium]|nr:cytochrome P450 [Burkholderiales bacterium]